MAARLSPLKAFRPSRSPLSLRHLSGGPRNNASGRSASSVLVEDMRTDRAENSASSRQGEIGSQLVKTFRKSQASAVGAARESLSAQSDIARATLVSKTVRRVWQSGDVYAPHDLSAAEVRKWRLRQAPTSDVFDELAINPLDEWKNVAMMYEFQTTMGRIKPRTKTGLRLVNQRKIAKAIRRGIGMGFLPSVHAHPEILRRNQGMVDSNR